MELVLDLPMTLRCAALRPLLVCSAPASIAAVLYMRVVWLDANVLLLSSGWYAESVRKTITILGPGTRTAHTPPVHGIVSVTCSPYSSPSDSK